MHSTASFLFAFKGLIAAHHHPDIYHAGDTQRRDPDWGLCQLDTVRDRCVFVLFGLILLNIVCLYNALEFFIYTYIRDWLIPALLIHPGSIQSRPFLLI